MRIDIVTLFPQMLSAMLDESILARARKKGHLQICCHQLRHYAVGRNGKVDDTMFGGGQGMLLAAEPIARCFDAIEEHIGQRPYRIYMSPKGRVLSQEGVKTLSQHRSLTILCGHYEGVDQRLLDAYIDEEISIGDYVLTGGEIPAMVLTDAVGRMLPGVLSDPSCFEDESHFDGLLEYPQYTRPETWRGRRVPPVLLSGHHEKIQKWKRKESLLVTRERRPDLFRSLTLTSEDEKSLAPDR